MSSQIPPYSPRPSTNTSGSSSSSHTSEPTGEPKPFQKKEQKKQSDQGQGQVDPDLKKMEGEQKTEGVQTSFKTEGVQQKMELSKIHEVILRGVDAMRVSQDGKMVEVDLKTTPNLPKAFQGGTMTLKTEGEVTTIRFDNVNVSQAKMLMDNEAAKQEIAQMLAAKNIHRAQIQLGDSVTINLSKEGQQIQSPMQTQFGQQQDYTQREGGGKGGGQGGGQGEDQDQPSG